MTDNLAKLPDAPIVVDLRGTACWITLNRPHALNAITPEMLDAIGRELNAIEGDDGVRSVVVTGNGKAFCAGADLKSARARTEVESAEAAQAANAAFTASFGALLSRLESFPKPVIAAVNGIAVAAGIEVLLCCDLAIAAASARIGDAHANYGLLPGGGSSVRLPRRVGVGLAKYLAYTGDLLPAEAFVGTDLVFRVVPDAQLEAAVMELTSKLGDKSPLVLSRAKSLINDGVEMPLEVALRHERDMNKIHATSHDRREGLAAFAERRKPKFTGR